MTDPSSPHSCQPLFRYVGEWYDRDKTDDGIPDDTMKNNASDVLFITAGIYGVFAVFSVGLLVLGSKRK